MNELKNSITKLKLLKDKTTDEQQKIELEGAIELLRNECERLKIDTAQLEDNPYEEITKKMQDTHKRVTAFYKNLQEDLDDIEKLLQYPGRIKKLIKNIITMFG